jgi:hypothetical protein
MKHHHMISRALLLLTLLFAQIVPDAAYASTDMQAQGMANTALQEVSTVRLKQAAAAAATANPITSPYWQAPPAWAASTAYWYGNVVSIGGNWYSCVIQGTSASSGGPSGSANANIITDGTVGWTYIGGAQTPYTADGAPAISFTTTDPALGTNWYPSAQPSAYHIRGANHAVYSTAYWTLPSFNASATTTNVSIGSSVVFAVNDAKVAIYMPQYAFARILVDDRYISPNTYYAVSNSWVEIDWTGSTGRRTHTYEVEVNKVAQIFGGIETTTSGFITQIYNPAEVRVAVITDSFGAGSSYGSFRSGAQIPFQMNKLLGWRDVWDLGWGGTGEDAQGTGNAFYTFGQRVPQAVALHPNVIELFGSVNDPLNSYTPSQVQAATLSTLQSIRAFTNVPVIVFGVPSVYVATNGTIATENAIAAAVTAMNDPYIFFIPISTASVPWALGTWNNTGLGVGGSYPNNGGYMIAQDGIHPPEIGQDYYSRIGAESVRRLVLPNL